MLNLIRDTFEEINPEWSDWCIISCVLPSEIKVDFACVASFIKLYVVVIDIALFHLDRNEFFYWIQRYYALKQ